MCIFLVQYYLHFVAGYLSIIPWSVLKQYLQQILSIFFILIHCFFKCAVCAKNILTNFSIWLSKCYAISTSPNQFLLDRGILGLVGFDADCYYINVYHKIYNESFTMKLYKKYPFTPSKLKNKYISTLKYCEYMCPGFAWSECMNYLLECNAKLYAIVTVWEMIVYV